MEVRAIVTHAQKYDLVRAEGRDGVFVIARVDTAARVVDVVARNERGFALDVPFEQLSRIPARWREY